MGRAGADGSAQRGSSDRLDFPNALAVARDFTAEAGLDKRISFAEGDALKMEWPGGNDVVLMSYLFSALAPEAIAELCSRAYGALQPGGILIVHDFMVEDDGTGPPMCPVLRASSDHTFTRISGCSGGRQKVGKRARTDAY